MKQRWHRAINVALALVVAILVHALFQPPLPVVASPDGLTFYSGFEFGDFTEEWSQASGSVSVQSTIKKTGDYAMRSNPSASFGFIIKNVSGNTYRLSFYLYIATAPNTDRHIAGSYGGVAVILSSDRFLKLYDGGLEDTGNTQLNTSKWYRISLSLDEANDAAKIYLDGVEECSSTTVTGSALGHWLGSPDTVTFDLYFDNYVVDDVESTSDIGDIRVVRSRPNVAGNYTEFNTVVGDTVHYGQVDEYPASDSDYVAHAASSAAKDSYGLLDCSSIGIGFNDTIRAVSTWVRVERDGGGVTDHSILVRDNGSDFETLFEPLQNEFDWYVRYDNVLPSGGGAWTQARFNSLEAGGSKGTGGQGYFLSCVMVMVAYEAVSTLDQSWYLSSDTSPRIMYKEDDSKTVGMVPVGDDGSEIWRADEVSTVDVGFPADTWTGYLTFDAGSNDTTVRVYVGKWNGTIFTAATGQADITGSSWFSFSAGAFDVPTDEWLACKIEDYADGDSDDAEVSVGGSLSYVTSPTSEPGYPIPELPTIILIGTGLACLGGYIAFMRRKRKSVSP